MPLVVMLCPNVNFQIGFCVENFCALLARECKTHVDCSIVLKQPTGTFKLGGAFWTRVQGGKSKVSHVIVHL